MLILNPNHIVLRKKPIKNLGKTHKKTLIDLVKGDE